VTKRNAWHFLSSDWTAYGGFKVEVGALYTMEPPIVPCSRGFHASVRCIDALRYAPGPVVTLVECDGAIVDHGSPVDKFACSERRAVWGYDATEELRYFARWCALEVIHLWPNAPEVVREYLESGDESIRVEARKLAYAAYADASSAAASSAAAYHASADASYPAAYAAAYAAYDADAAYYAAAAAGATYAKSTFIEEANRVLESLLVDGAVARGLL
jgi:hypothetical protein